MASALDWVTRVQESQATGLSPEAALLANMAEFHRIMSSRGMADEVDAHDREKGKRSP